MINIFVPFHPQQSKRERRAIAQGGDGEHSEPYYLERYDERTIISAGMKRYLKNTYACL